MSSAASASLSSPEGRPKAILLDIQGTVFPAAAAAPVFKELGLPEDAVELWFARVLRDGFAAQGAGLFVPFREVGAAHLDTLLAKAGRGGSVSGEEALQRVIAAWAAARLFPDVLPGLQAIAAAGVKVAALTNGSVEKVARPVLEGGGAAGLVGEGALLDINMAQAWKPFPASYAYACSQLGLEAQEVAMVAAHPWDIAGARQAGLRGIYMAREGAAPWPPYLPPPEATATSFTHLAQLLGAGGSR